jgi:hypothetical protein
VLVLVIGVNGRWLGNGCWEIDRTMGGFCVIDKLW